MAQFYFRCNSGHYFTGTHCPMDGWSSEGSHELNRLAEKLIKMNVPLTVDNLINLGLSEGALQRTILIEFGNDKSMFDAIVPKGYVIHKEWQPLEKLDEYFN